MLQKKDHNKTNKFVQNHSLKNVLEIHCIGSKIRIYFVFLAFGDEGVDNFIGSTNRI